MSDCSLARAGAWMLGSGIQEPSGGVARYYRVDHGLNNPVSTEITGYAVSAFCFLFEQTGEAAYREAALRSANFLVRQAWRPELGLFPFEWPPDAEGGLSPAYFFDAGIIARALLRVYRLTGDTCWRNAVVAIAAGMLQHVRSHGEIAPILHLPEIRPLDYGGSWSNNPGCYQLKSALAWLELYRETQDERWGKAWEGALQQALATQASFLPGVHDHHRVMDRLHAYSYFLEALTAIPGQEAMLRAGIERVSRYLREIRPEFVRSDVYAQLLRVRLLAGDVDQVAAEEEAAGAASFQYSSPDRRLDGGFCFGARAGQWLPYANPVSTAFCVQAIAWWDQYRRGGFQSRTSDLI